jgi:protease-4
VITKIYNEFVNLVAKTRDLDPGYVDGIAKGRVWSGEDALQLGLVNQIGGLEDAIKYAAEKANLGENYRLRAYPIRKPFFQQIVDEIKGETKARIVDDELGNFKTYYDQIKTLQKMKGAQARLPFFYTMN